MTSLLLYLVVLWFLLIADLAINAANEQSAIITSNVWFLLITDLAIIAANDQSTIIISNDWSLSIADLAIIAANDQSTIITSSVMVLIDSSPCYYCS